MVNKVPVDAFILVSNSQGSDRHLLQHSCAISKEICQTIGLGANELQSVTFQTDDENASNDGISINLIYIILIDDVIHDLGMPRMK